MVRMNVVWWRADRRLRYTCLLLVLAWGLAPAGLVAHEGDGVDAGYGHVRAVTTEDGFTTFELQISETDDCAGFHATEIIAERDAATVYGDMEQTGPCAFGGSIELPERGRWTVTLWVAYNGNPADIQIPVGFSGEPGTFERSDWMHVEASISSGTGDAWYRPSGTLTFAAIGLAIGTVIELARRRWMTGARG